MAKKTFLHSARVVKGARWYIDFQRFDPETGESKRSRKDFDLNDIADIAVRTAVADILCRHLEYFAPVATGPVKEEKRETVAEALALALAVKLKTPRKNTHRGYKSITGTFSEWLKARHYAELQVDAFTVKHAQAFFDYLVQRKAYRGRTLNNYLLHLRALWSELVSREIAPKNVFQSVKPARQEEKLRRPFTDEERRVVAAYIRDNDYWLFRALLLQYYCFIRPVEIARLRFKSFDLAKGTVKVESFEAKTWKTRYATIPKDVLRYFVDGTFEVQPANYYMLGSIDGKTVGPAPKPAHENRAYRRHANALKKLKASGALKDITGLTWYSWKDTGITAHARHTSPLSTRDQAGHTDFDVTLIYYHNNTVNQEYLNLPDNLI